MGAGGDRFNLQRFVDAQAPVYEQVCRELAGGAKRTHWMWFIFPQSRGLGLSATSQFFAIGSDEEAAAYLQHETLGARLLDCTRLVNRIEGKSVHAIFGSPDDLKFHSSMTLFAKMDTREHEFRNALKKFFAGQPSLHA